MIRYLIINGVAVLTYLVNWLLIGLIASLFTADLSFWELIFVKELVLVQIAFGWFPALFIRQVLLFPERG